MHWRSSEPLWNCSGTAVPHGMELVPAEPGSLTNVGSPLIEDFEWTETVRGGGLNVSAKRGIKLQNKMPAHGKILLVDKNGLPPEVELTIGQAQWGEYVIYLWDSQHHNPVQIGAGLNSDNVPDKFFVGNSAAALEGRRVSWQVGIASPKTGPGQKYALTVRVTQGGVLVPGGLIEDSGALSRGSIFLRDFVQFQIKQ